MNVEGVTPNAAGQGMSGASPIAGGRFDGQLQGALGDVASLLGLTSQQLKSGLAAGGNLSAVASGTGVSDDRLVSTIKQGLQDAGSKLTGTRLDNIAQRIAHHRRMHVQVPAGSTTPGDWSASAAPASNTGAAPS